MQPDICHLAQKSDWLSGSGSARRRGSWSRHKIPSLLKAGDKLVNYICASWRLQTFSYVWRSASRNARACESPAGFQLSHNFSWNGAMRCPMFRSLLRLRSTCPPDPPFSPSSNMTDWVIFYVSHIAHTQVLLYHKTSVRQLFFTVFRIKFQQKFCGLSAGGAGRVFVQL